MSNVWDVYSARANARGTSIAEARTIREARSIHYRLPEGLSYFDVTVDGVSQKVGISNTDNLNEKKIFSMPGEDLRHGGLVDWMEQHWLIDELDYNRTLYTKGHLLQCNYLLKWVTEDREIHEQWCAVEDGTKLRN